MSSLNDNVASILQEAERHKVERDFLDRHANFVRSVLRADWDWWTCDEGFEGTGKSTGAIHEARRIGRDLFVLEDHVVYDADELLRLVDDAPRYGSIIFDEAGEAAFSRDFNSEINKALVRASQQIRDRNLHIIFNLPALELLDTGLRRRFKTLVIFEAPNFNRGRSLWHCPVHNRYGNKSAPYWDHQWTYYFQPLPAAYKDRYTTIKTKRGKERVARYLDSVCAEQEKHNDVDPRRLVAEIRKLSPVEQERYKSTKGTWSRDRIRFEHRVSESCARIVAAGLAGGTPGAD
jgi:hypothetical protein